MLESLFDKVADLEACNFIKKRLQHRSFPLKFAKFLRTSISKNICERLFLILLVYYVLICQYLIVQPVLSFFQYKHQILIKIILILIHSEAATRGVL